MAHNRSFWDGGRDEEHYTATHTAIGGPHQTGIESTSKTGAKPSAIPEALIPIGVSEEVKMHRTVVLQRFLWGISLSMAAWLVAGGPIRAGEGTVAAGMPRVVETEWPGVTVELTSIEPDLDNTILLRFQYVNNSSETAEISHSVYDILQRMYYIDITEKHKYSAVRSATGLATIVGTDRPGPVSIEPRQSASFWVKFPAPSAGVEQIDLYFPRALPMKNVPLH
jgi:hypothetical protein